MSGKIATWDSLHQSACATIQAQIDDATVTWSDVFNAPPLWILKVRASWWAVGKSDKEIVAEAKRRYLAMLKEQAGEDDEDE